MGTPNNGTTTRLASDGVIIARRLGELRDNASGLLSTIRSKRPEHLGASPLLAQSTIDGIARTLRRTNDAAEELYRATGLSPRDDTT